MDFQSEYGVLCCATSVIRNPGREYSRVREVGGMAEGTIRRFLPPTHPRYACFVSVGGYFVPLAVLLCRSSSVGVDVRSADGIPFVVLCRPCG